MPENQSITSKNDVSPLCFFLCVHLGALAQKHDYQWIIGLDHKNAPVVDTYGLVRLDFNYLNRPKMIKLPKTDMYFTGTNASMSDSSGRLLFYSNGSKIFGWNHQLMQNGDTLSPYYKKIVIGVRGFYRTNDPRCLIILRVSLVSEWPVLPIRGICMCQKSFIFINLT